MRKILALILTALMVLSIAPGVFATVKTDTGLNVDRDVTVSTIEEALNGTGMNFTYTNDPAHPWIPDGETFTNRAVGATTIQGIINSSTTISMTVDMQANELFSFDWFISSEGSRYGYSEDPGATAYYDYVTFKVNGEFVFKAKGNEDATAPIDTMETYVFDPEEAGTYTFEWTYQKDNTSNGGLDAFFLDNCMISTLGPATDISVTPTEAEIMDTQTVQLTATVLPATADDLTVTWTSSDNSVATVDENGLVSGVGAGTATITATSNSDPSLQATATITVLSTEEVNRALSDALNVEGGTLSFINDAVHPWVVDGTTYEDRVVAKASNVNIDASAGTISLTVEAEVGKQLVFDWYAYTEGYSWDYLAFYANDTMVTKVGGRNMTGFEHYTYEIPEDGTYNFTWTYLKDASGSEGALEIAVLDEVELIDAPEELEGIVVDPTEVEMGIDEKATITVAPVPESATLSEITWTTSDAAVATVEDGVITGVGAGTATITATSAEGFTATVEVEVKNTTGTATIIVTVGDPWGDGSGYQMLLDADANAFENGIIPETADTLSPQIGDVPDWIYDEFEYKMPENADGAVDTTNILLNETAILEIPAGTYDYCITNPDPLGYVCIANGNAGRGDDFVFVAGGTYTYTVILDQNVDFVEFEFEAEPGPAISVELNHQTTTIELGNTLQLVAIMEYDNATSVISDWTSSNTSVATVDDNGLVTALALGTTTITATTDNGLTATCDITVISIAESLNAPEMDLTYTNDNVNTWVPDTTTFTNRNVGATSIQGMDRTSTTLSLTVDLEADEFFSFDWFVSSEGATAVTEDESTMTWGWYDYATFKVNGEFVFAAKGNNTAHTLVPIDSMETYVFEPTEAGTYIFEWTYNKDVNDAEGLDAFFLDNCMIHAPTPVTDISVTPAEAEIMDTQTVQLTATVLPVTAEDLTVTWTSNDNSVATVDANGMVLGIAPGTAVITATSNSNPAVSATATITVISSEEVNRDLREALNVEGGSLPFMNDGAHPWVVDGTSFEGRLTAKSAIEGISSTTSSVTLNNVEAEQGQTMTFDWFVSSESGNYDYLAFYVNDTLIERISGEEMTDFESYSYQIPEDGMYNFRWTYRKDSSDNGGLDAGWLDEVELVAATEPPEDTYTVTFYDWDGTVLDTQEVEEGSDATLPTDPSREGYIFLGWEGNYTNVTSDESVYAVYRLIGDANGDGSLNTGDAAYILRYVIDLVDMTPEALLVADINGDGMVNTGDAAKLLELLITAR